MKVIIVNMTGAEANVKTEQTKLKTECALKLLNLPVQHREALHICLSSLSYIARKQYLLFAPVLAGYWVSPSLP